MLHDADRVERDIFDGLSQDSRALGLLLGAGCPLAIPVNGPGEPWRPLIQDIAGLTRAVMTRLEGNQALASVLAHFHEEGVDAPNVEAVLSQTRTLVRVLGKTDFRGTSVAALDELESEVCRLIAQEVAHDLPHGRTPYHSVARWIASATRAAPVSVFTTNYDLLMEQAFEDLQSPYFDGFVGTREPFFDTVAIEEEALPARWPRLWKLHGSLNWRLRGKKVVRVPDGAGREGDVLLVHPSDRKYDDSRRMPYLVMIDRLKEFVRRPGAFLATAGYSFGDQHLNEVMFQGLRSNPTASVFGLLYGPLNKYADITKRPESLPPNLALLAQDGAVLRSRVGDWRTEEGDTSPRTFKLGDFQAFGDVLDSVARRRSE